MSDLEQGVRQQVLEYLGGRSDVAGLYEWITNKGWEVERRDPQGAAMLREIQLYLEELRHGDWSEDELKSHLRGVVRFLGYDVPPSSTTTVTDSQSTTSDLRLVMPRWTFAGTPLDTARA